ncbi:unnamed protein product [Nippostrongylus brasiliensis]|uniref:MULE domain-containing protein n=1 Tax=Nippostrongylus brasiliensis TaxID=27835 RepID=A0A0N4Y6T4_NIPBR|nr:unnamed protein product [Nippostrongylus brasiliensis]
MPSALFTCQYCGRDMEKRNLWPHLRNVHKRSEEEVQQIREKINRESGKAKISCPSCEDLFFMTYEEFANHCRVTHSEDESGGRPQDYSLVQLRFNDEKEYEKWLNEKCETTCTSLYIARTITIGDKKYQYLQCTRAGLRASKATKNVGVSRKENVHCSCFLATEFNADGSVSVKGCFGHVGHDIDPALLRLSNQQKQYLRMLLEEHSFDYIIKRLRREDPTKSTKLSFIVKQDLWSIIEKYNMKPGYRHEDDVESVALRYNEKNPDDGIRVFRPPIDRKGNELLVVVITPTMLEWLKKYSSRGITLDDTFHTTRYSARLATLMVADERDRGLPGAFLLSGTMTASDVERMFLEIQSLYPEFEPKKIVTDEAPCFYNGFKAVFPEAKTSLHYCRFHILQTWKRNCKDLVEASIRPTILSAMQALLAETRLEVFEQRFAEILALLRTKGQMKMVDYLEKNYLGRCPTWASFSNKGAVMDTSMISERFHLRIKEEFLHRNAHSRIDGILDLLIRSVEEISEAVEVKERRRFVNIAFRVQETHKRHKRAVEVYKAEMVTVMNENKWRVHNRDGTKSYDVTWEGECQCDSQRNTHCMQCGVCAYSWTCTCLDNRAGISCAHRHAAKMVQMAVSDVQEAADQPPCSSGIEEQGPSEFHVEEVTTEAQRLKEACYHELSAIKQIQALTQANALAFAKLGTSEALQALKEIRAYEELASDIQMFPSSSLVPRPEMAQPGAKRKLSTISLWERAKLRKPKIPKEDDESFRKEVQTMKDLLPFTMAFLVEATDGLSSHKEAVA